MTATGIGASLSNVLAGYVSDHFGHSVAFLGLSGVGCVGLCLIALVMPETRNPSVMAGLDPAIHPLRK